MSKPNITTSDTYVEKDPAINALRHGLHKIVLQDPSDAPFQIKDAVEWMQYWFDKQFDRSAYYKFVRELSSQLQELEADVDSEEETDATDANEQTNSPEVQHV